MNKIKHIFFDLDHTLWDYERNSREALEKLYLQFGLDALGLHPMDKFMEAFRLANLQVWDLFDENRINSDRLRHKRLELVFAHFDLPNQTIYGFHEGYFHHCSTGTHLMEGALELLTALAPRYELHIITNGFNDSQQTKLSGSGLLPFFKTVTTSESAESKKPDPAYFDFALKLAGANKANSLVVGDGLRTDVTGAVNYGLPVVWFNPEQKLTDLNVRQIQHLMEISDILG